MLTLIIIFMLGISWYLLELDKGLMEGKKVDVIWTAFMCEVFLESVIWSCKFLLGIVVLEFGVIFLGK